MSELRRILFVDDEVRVLDGIADLLRRHRRRWQIELAVGGRAAMKLLDQKAFDVVVTDLRMPEVDGFAVLDRLRDAHPGTVRFALSGDPKRETAIRTMPHAHRILEKPCKGTELEAALESACHIRELVADPALRDIVGRVSDLPPMPETFTRLLRALEDPGAAIGDVARILSADIALSAKVLQIANSPIFGGGRKVASVEHAIVVLGTDLLRSIVFSEGAMGRRELPPSARRFAADLNLHSLEVASVAADLTKDVAVRRDAFAAGMLHDVGRLVAVLEPEFPALEQNHAKVGAYLLSLWGVPQQIVIAVSEHHHPMEMASSETSRLVIEAENLVENPRHR